MFTDYPPAPPFALSLSKGFPCLAGEAKGEGFDKLSPNGERDVDRA